MVKNLIFEWKVKVEIFETIRMILISSLFASAATFLLAFVEVGKVAARNFARMRDFFANYPVEPGDIVMAGDSITDLGLWNEILPDVPVKNRGISAETSKGLLRRLGDITRGQPAAIFILIGTNDLPWYMLRTVEAILKTYTEIIEKIQSEAPGTRIFVQSILPRKWWYVFSIQRLNHGLRQLAQDYHCTYVDLYTSFATLNGIMRKEYSNDHLHLLAAGYRRWAEILQPYLQEVKAEVLQSTGLIEGSEQH